MAQIAAQRYTGTSVKRSEDPRILTGGGRYVDDIKLPGMLHAAFVRSPLAHGRVLAVDAAAARELPGVVAVYTGADMAAMTLPGQDPLFAMMGGGGPAPEYTLLATDKVRFVGDPVAIVVAESRYLAEDGCELVEVDYEDLPPVATAAAALDAGSPPLFANLDDNIIGPHKRTEFGDVAGTFAGADLVERVPHRRAPPPERADGGARHRRELRPGDSAVLTAHAATQGVHMTRMGIAMRLGMEPDKVRVLAGDIGGSFGLKIGASREELAVAAASRALGRPVKWTEDRSENLAASGHAREESFDVRAAVSKDGDLLGLDVAMVIDIGAYPVMGTMVAGIVEAMLPGPYKLAALGFESTAVATNKASYIAYRGPWASETFVTGAHSRPAREGPRPRPAGDPAAQRRTAHRPPVMMVTGRPLVGVTTRESLERVAEMVDIPAFRRRQAAGTRQGPLPGHRPRDLHRGRARTAPARRAERPDGPGAHAPAARRRRHRDAVHRPDAARAEPPDHARADRRRRVRRAVRAGPRRRRGQRRGAVRVHRRQPVGHHDRRRRAARRPAAQGQGARLRVAAHRGERRGPGDRRRPGPGGRRPGHRDRRGARSPGGPRRGSSADDVDTSLEVEASFDGGEGGWSGGSHCAIVEVDVETGIVTVERYVAAEDCGALINPAVVEGQIRGGIAQGIGAVLLERSAYDEDGNYQSATFMDYLLPTACEIPRFEIEHLETVPLDADVNFRGVGEGGMIVAPPTLVNAIEDALTPFGVRIYEQHLPPARILELIEEAAG